MGRKGKSFCTMHCNQVKGQTGWVQKSLSTLSVRVLGMDGWTTLDKGRNKRNW